MPQIKDRPDFSPSRAALGRWLSTHKADVQAGYSLMPGFFSDYKVSEDKNWFWGGILSEVIGVALICVSAAKKGTAFLFGAIVATVLFTILDIMIARWLHRNEAKRTWIRSKKYLTDDKGTLVLLEEEYKNGAGIDWGLRILIGIMALTKIVVAVALLATRNPVFYVFVAALYSIIVYIHIVHTGFALAHSKTEDQFNEEYKKGFHVMPNEVNDTHRFTTKHKLILPITGSHATIIEDEGKESDRGKEGFHYILKSPCVLIDEDISLLMRGQERAAKDVIAHECRTYQMEFAPVPEGLAKIIN
jgi:hypothetical protein